MIELRRRPRGRVGLRVSESGLRPPECIIHGVIGLIVCCIAGSLLLQLRYQQEPNSKPMLPSPPLSLPCQRVYHKMRLARYTSFAACMRLENIYRRCKTRGIGVVASPQVLSHAATSISNLTDSVRPHRGNPDSFASLSNAHGRSSPAQETPLACRLYRSHQRSSRPITTPSAEALHLGFSPPHLHLQPKLTATPATQTGTRLVHRWAGAASAANVKSSTSTTISVLASPSRRPRRILAQAYRFALRITSSANLSLSTM